MGEAGLLSALQNLPADLWVCWIQELWALGFLFWLHFCLPFLGKTPCVRAVSQSLVASLISAARLCTHSHTQGHTHTGTHTWVHMGTHTDTHLGIHTNTYRLIHTKTHRHTQAHRHTQVHYTQAHTWTHTQAHRHTYRLTHKHTDTHTQAHIHTATHMGTKTAHTRAHTYIQSHSGTHVCMHTHIHTHPGTHTQAHTYECTLEFALPPLSSHALLCASHHGWLPELATQLQMQVIRCLLVSGRDMAPRALPVSL